MIEDCGGYTGNNTFRAGASIRFDGLFGVGVLDSADVALQDCSLHRNRFGGVWAGGSSTGLTLSRCNLVANGSDNDPGKDVAIYSAGLAVSATDCFFGLAGGPTFDGGGPGNGVLGSISFAPLATAPYDAPAFAVTQARSVVAADRSVALAVGDLTGDGWNEIVAAGDRSGTVEVHVNSANGFVAREVTTVSISSAMLISAWSIVFSMAASTPSTRSWNSLSDTLGPIEDTLFRRAERELAQYAIGRPQRQAHCGEAPDGSSCFRPIERHRRPKFDRC